MATKCNNHISIKCNNDNHMQLVSTRHVCKYNPQMHRASYAKVHACSMVTLATSPDTTTPVWPRGLGQ